MRKVDWPCLGRGWSEGDRTYREYFYLHLELDVTVGQGLIRALEEFEIPIDHIAGR